MPTARLIVSHEGRGVKPGATRWKETLTDGGAEVEKLALADFRHTLINSAGFLYVD